MGCLWFVAFLLRYPSIRTLGMTEFRMLDPAFKLCATTSVKSKSVHLAYLSRVQNMIQNMSYWRPSDTAFFPRSDLEHPLLTMMWRWLLKRPSSSRRSRNGPAAQP